MLRDIVLNHITEAITFCRPTYETADAFKTAIIQSVGSVTDYSYLEIETVYENLLREGLFFTI